MEAGIKSIKYHVRRIDDAFMQDRGMFRLKTTLLNNDLSDFVAIIRGHFLIGESPVNIPASAEKRSHQMGM